MMINGEVLLCFSTEKPFALCDGRAIYPSKLSADLTQSIELLHSGDGDVLVTCKGRYEFSVALISSWLVGKHIILPPNLHQATLEHIRRQHSIATELSDGFTETGCESPDLEVTQKVFELRFNCNQQAVTIYTSGSTGKPKPVNKTIGNIFSEAFALKEALKWPDRALVASVPPHHLYGLTFSILLPWVLGIPMVDECPLHAEEVVDALRRMNAGILITVPVHLRALLDQEFRGEPVMVISSAGSLDQAIAEQWFERFERQIIEIYGSSETGVIGHRRQLSDKRWRPFPEVRAARNEEGLLQVISPFTHACEGEILQTQDLVSIEGDSYFLLHGRADSIVKIAGKRVSLLAVEEAIKRCRGVFDAAVAAVPVQGYIRDMAIWAAVAIGESNEMNARMLRSELQSQLDGIEIPRRIVMLKQLPREENGKLRRQRLMALFRKEKQV